MSIMEMNGFDPANLFGVDLSPKAIELNKKEHPKYNCRVVEDFRCDRSEAINLIKPQLRKRNQSSDTFRIIAAFQL